MDHCAFDRIIRNIGVLSRRKAIAAVAAAVVSDRGNSSAVAGKQAEGRKKLRKCATGKVRCGKACVNPLASVRHCGGCGKACADGSQCISGVCCPAGKVNCGGVCKASCQTDPGVGPTRPFPQRVAYPGQVSVIAHRTAEQQAADVRGAYDRWKERYLKRWGTDGSGNPLNWIVYNGGGDETVSEAMGFGMIIVATMAGYDADARTIFDGLWRFVLAHPSCNDARLMTWHVDAAGNALGGCSSAFDGDADIAYGLLLAEAQWGNAGEIDYGAAFGRLIAGIEASTIGPVSRLPMLGDWVDPDGTGKFGQWSFRTSDVMPGHFRAFAAATGRPLWNEARTQSLAAIERLQTVYATQTGLLPDFAQPESSGDHRARPADQNFLEGPTDDDYNYNAGRDPWRIATDALLAGDSVAAAQARRIASWARVETSGNPARLRSGYAINGVPLANSEYFSTFFAAPIGVAAMVDPDGEAWLQAVYDLVRDASEGYYQDSVALLCLLVMTRNFWTPA